jgi:L-ascorbate metabolism protein UlaG (beta-lactamase superfamily)
MFNTKIKYLYNSGFKLETENSVLIFDYFPNKEEMDSIITEKDLSVGKDIYVFASHSHADHYTKDILEWMEFRPDIQYILSSDIECNRNSNRITKISAYEELEIGKLYVKAYGSTDKGISFLVKVDGTAIFHAGDLNWWYWWDDSEEEIQKAESLYKKEVSMIKGESIDIAFFPVDSRLEHNYALGGEYFIEHIKPKIFIPMHFREDFNITKDFSERNKNSSSRILKILRSGEEIGL